ncbi:hydantoinase/oxoprolinase family protein [Rhodosalinus halophilus]|uniref:Hydantoinase/oxoprolinase family protein n=1 Tax=Rhodosalinus halophilus TaxID=2259333 RepID=A0A365U8V9_9RHOB|nr:hydantoinase/oxoprolinase family protein [Rhodosalinus halophilus]RBI84274.1 hydantoinase/oxoprolinase family protein [Rhodosalinus halophilus]
MTTTEDLIRTYESRLAEIEARLARVEGAQAPAPRAARRRGTGDLRLGVDVGGTFTDLLLLDEGKGRIFTAKVPSTPKDSSIGVLNGIEKICREAGIRPSEIAEVMHGTTVATNTVLTGSGARVGLVTTKGYRDTLQIARSYVPGGLGGWVIWNKSLPLARLEDTIEADERIDAKGHVLVPLDEKKLRKDLEKLAETGIEALTVSLFNAYVSDIHERRIAEIAAQIMPGIPISTSAGTMPEMYEYERTETTVVNSYVRPVVANYVSNLQTELKDQMGDVMLQILRSDGGLSSAQAAMDHPVNLLMSGPAGGVSGAKWIAKNAGFDHLLTFDMGGTSTDVALIEGGEARTRRETRVGDVTVRAPSIDVRTVGAGGGSIAYTPELTKALRVGPQSAGADPGPAAYKKGGEEPTVTDANVVLGYLPADAKLGGDMDISRDLAAKAVQKVADALDKTVEEAAEGIIAIVNENMVGALRLVSVEQGYDPRDFALIGFGGAGPLHANALARLIGAWPAIVPPGPGVLCAYGDATTRLRNEASQTFVKNTSATSDREVGKMLEELADRAAQDLEDEGVTRSEQETIYQIDIRYAGQGMKLTLDVTPEDFQREGLAGVEHRFDREHEQLFTFALDAEHELVGLRAVVQGAEKPFIGRDYGTAGPDASGAVVHETKVYEGGQWHATKIYDRAKLKAGNRIPGPAIVTEMDSTSLILPGHVGVIDKVGNILIWPEDHEKAR